MNELNGPQRRHLRALAHHLSPVVQVGKQGVSPAVANATDAALTTHELIKVRLPQVDRGERQVMAEALRTATGAQAVSVVGRVLLLYRRHPEEPQIELPR